MVLRAINFSVVIETFANNNFRLHNMTLSLRVDGGLEVLGIHISIKKCIKNGLSTKSAPINVDLKHETKSPRYPETLQETPTNQPIQPTYPTTFTPSPTSPNQPTTISQGAAAASRSENWLSLKIVSIRMGQRETCRFFPTISRWWKKSANHPGWC